MTEQSDNSWGHMWRDILEYLNLLNLWQDSSFTTPSSVELMLGEPWFSNGLFVLFGFPIALLISTEILFWLQRKNSPWLSFTRHIRNWLIPSFFAHILLLHVLNFSSESVSVRLVLTLFWVVFIYSALKLLDTLIFSKNSQFQLQQQVPKLLIDFLRLFLVLLGAAFVLAKVWHLDLAQLLTALSVGSLVLGLALQNVMGSLFSGIALLSSRPFSVGDWIKIREIEGQVTSMDWRAVSLKDRQGDLVVIPNAMIAEESFHNYSQPSIRHIETLLLNFSYEDPPNQVKACLMDAALACEFILSEPKPEVELEHYGDFNVSYRVNYVIEDYAKQPEIRDDFVSRVWYISRRYQLRFAARPHMRTGKTETVSLALFEQLDKLSNLDLPKADQEQLLQHAHIDNYGKGEILLNKGDLAKAFYMLLEGEAVELIQINHSDEPLNHLRQGDFIGAASMIRRMPSNVSVKALSDLKVLAVDINAMQQVLQHHVHIAQHLENLVEMRENRIRKILENRS